MRELSGNYCGRVTNTVPEPRGKGTSAVGNHYQKTGKDPIRLRRPYMCCDYPNPYMVTFPLEIINTGLTGTQSEVVYGTHPSPNMIKLQFQLTWRIIFRRRSSAVGMATACGLDDRGVEVRVPVGPRIFTSPYCPDRLWGPTSLLSYGYRGPFPGVKAVRGVKLPTHIQLLPKSRKRGSIHPLPHTSSWYSAYLVKDRGSVTFTFTEDNLQTQ
jgi:hypothetical protein